MKAFKKIILTTLISCVLLVPFITMANAEALSDPDNIKSVFDFFGIDLDDPEGVQTAIDEIKEGGLSGIMNMLGIDVNDLLNELQYYLDDMNGTTLPVAANPDVSETTTAQATTEAGTTEKPVTSAPPPVYAPTYPSYTPPSTSKPLPGKPAVSATTEKAENTEEPATEEESTTELIATEEQTTETIKESVISKDTVTLIILTIAIFIAGLGTGIFVSRRISENQREKYE